MANAANAVPGMILPPRRIIAQLPTLVNLLHVSSEADFELTGLNFSNLVLQGSCTGRYRWGLHRASRLAVCIPRHEG